MSSIEEKCEETQRRDNWDDEEVRMLLEVWGDDRVQADLEGIGRNITMYRRIADRLISVKFPGARARRLLREADIVNNDNCMAVTVSSAILLC